MTGDMDPASRDRVLDEISSAYRDYETGRAGRWDDRTPGSRIARAQRDAWLVDALSGAGQQRVVDVGCGDGFLARLLEPRRPTEFLGLDLLPERVAGARELVPWARFEVGSGDRIPVEDGWATAAAAVTLFSSVPDEAMRAAIAREMARVVAPGGRIVLYDLRYPSPGNRRVRPVGGREVGRLFPGWSVRTRSLTLLPPLARSILAGGERRYRLLHAVPPLRSHVAVILTRP